MLENTRLCFLRCSRKSLAHGNSYKSIGPNFNVGRSTVPEVVQDVIEVLYDLRNEYIKYPITEAETQACIQTF